MKTTCSLLLLLLLPPFLFAQAGNVSPPGYLPPVDSELSASEIFEKVIRHYDPKGVWNQFEGSMHMYTIGNGTTGEEDLSINNADGFRNSSTPSYWNLRTWRR